MQSSISKTGGWCRKESRANGGKHVTDLKLAKALVDFLGANASSTSVGSFGDGPGEYKKHFDKNRSFKGIIKRNDDPFPPQKCLIRQYFFPAVYDAFDGSPFGKETSGGVVEHLDLSVPQYGLKASSQNIAAFL